jgi:GTP-dependent phosphoenolpyruvate carboxykinase
MANTQPTEIFLFSSSQTVYTQTYISDMSEADKFPQRRQDNNQKDKMKSFITDITKGNIYFVTFYAVVTRTQHISMCAH